MKINATQLSIITTRLAIGGIFLYFGTLAVFNPQIQGEVWVQEPFRTAVTSIISLSTFMISFGIIQILLALAIFANFLPKFVYFIAFLFLFGIIINLGIAFGFTNDVVIRDIALFLITLGIWLKLA